MFISPKLRHRSNHAMVLAPSLSKLSCYKPGIPPKTPLPFLILFPWQDHS